MKNKVTAIIMMAASALMGLSLAFPVIRLQRANVIGGADLPTFLFYFRQTAWLALLGLVSIVVCMILRHKK